VRVEVDLAGLGDTARQLRQAVGVAREVADHRSHLMGMVEDYGSAKLRSAVDSFLHQWGGMGPIVDDAENLASMLDSAVAAYGQVEGLIRDACR
jgi:hypothetical protein